MTKKEKLLKRYLETHTLADYEAYAACPEDAEDEEPKYPKKSKSSSKRG